MRAGLIAAACLTAWAQPDAKLAFEVASVKRVATAPGMPTATMGRAGGGGGAATPAGQVNYASISLKEVIKRAYNLKDYQVAGPDWMATEQYSIVAKPPEGSTQDQIPQMLQTLLADRFGLQVHHEERPVPIFALIPGKDGFKLKEGDESALKAVAESNSRLAKAMSMPGVQGFLMMAAQGQIVAKNVPVARLAEALTRQLERPVIDQSGLTGSYSFVLNWVPDASPEMTAAADRPIGLPLPGALQDQLGLKLDRRTSPADVLVVDHAEKVPTGN